jgi:hypothetical protein
MDRDQLLIRDDNGCRINLHEDQQLGSETRIFEVV